MYNNHIVFRLTFTGMMFALLLLMQFLERFMPFGDFGFVRFNLTMIFIWLVDFIIGIKFALGLIALRFVFGLIIDGNYSPFSVIGQLSLLVTGIIMLLVWNLINKFSHSKSEKNVWKWWLSLSAVSIVLVSLLMTLINGLLFVPWYFAVYDGNWHPALSFQATFQQYESARAFYFFIPSYWGGMFAVYLTFNILNLLINLILLKPLLRTGRILQKKMV